MIQEYNTPFSDLPEQQDNDLTLISIRARVLRDKILNETVDKVNYVWYSSLNYDQQEQLIEYRRALLNVPQQAGFPTDIQWPQKPSWL